jgi:hypothetical protein
LRSKPAAVEAALGDVEWVDAAEPQAFRRALIDTGLLEEMNRSNAAPKLKDGAMDLAALDRFGFAEREGRSYVAVMSGGGLRFVFVAIRVPVDSSKDAGGWSEARLHRLKDALAGLSKLGLRAAGKDRWGNTFAWTAVEGRSRWVVRYDPSADVVRVLMY